MKKSLVLILALALTLAFAAPALAENPVTADSGTGTTSVSYEVQPSFSVTIPATVALTKDGTTTGAVVLAADHLLPVGKTLNFAITAGTNYATDKWYVKGAGSQKTYEYTIKDNATPLTLNGKVALKATTVDTDSFAEVTKTLTFGFAEGVNCGFADTYTDSLTFTITLDNTL